MENEVVLIIRRKNSCEAQEERIVCASKEEAKSVRAETFATRNDVLFAYIEEKQVANV